MSEPNITAARVSRWIKTDIMKEQFGVEVRASGKWHHLAINGDAALFDTEEAAAAQVREVRIQIGVVKEAAA